MALHHESIGAGIPVVFIHAGIADRRMWDHQFETVPEGARYIRFDQRGFGETPVGEEPFSFHGDVLSLMDQLSIDAAVLVGCSIGGVTALGVAEAAPERVLGLVLVGSGAPGFEPPGGYHDPPQWPEAVKALEAGDLRRAAELDAEMWLAGHGRTLNDVDGDIVDLLIDMDLVALASEAEREGLRVPPDLTVLPRIDGPTLVLVGGHDLPDEVAAAAYLAEQLSDTEAVVVPDAAHLVSLQQPVVFNRLLADFLARIAR